YDLNPPGEIVDWDGSYETSPKNIKSSGPPFNHHVKVTDANGCVKIMNVVNNTSCNDGGVIGIVSNPATNAVNVTHNIPFAANTSTVIRDLGGNEVIRVNHGMQLPGNAVFTIDISSLFSGSYYVSGEYNGSQFGTIMLLIKNL
ncbi:MAG: hypothetical protein LLF83_07915, partial [Methanobacterium sp.]|nr:hypothetical protein [Methanobacterium sp.]